METIWKYEIPVLHTFALRIPQYARFLNVQMQDNKPVMWFLVDTDEANDVLYHRNFMLMGTGEAFPANYLQTAYLGTFLIGTFVGHLFEGWE